MPKHYNVLFLCTGNSAGSVMDEAIMNKKGFPHFTAYSAGSHPTGTVRPEALQRLEAARLSTAGLYSKSWNEFAEPDAPPLYFVFTVYDNAAKEVCPLWPGQPMTAQWGVPDPSAVKAHRKKLPAHSARPLPYWTAESVCFSVCHSQVSANWLCRKK